VFVETLLGVFGDYAMKATQELLMASRHERHPTEKADLHGRRLVAAVESDDGRRLAEAAVKEMTGGDTISARHMKKDFFRFKPSHSPMLVTNHKPKVYGTDHSIWRRLHLVPFTIRIPKAEQDRFLTQKLKAEWPAIVRWIVEGCLEWQRDGLNPPPEVQTATADYRRSEDVLGDFIAERCVVGPTYEVLVADLYRAYQDWAEHANEKVISKRAFGGRMTNRDEFERSKSSPWKYFGIGLKAV
jgi:putative DNA primase/helicase